MGYAHCKKSIIAEKAKKGCFLGDRFVVLANLLKNFSGSLRKLKHFLSVLAATLSSDKRLQRKGASITQYPA